MALDVAATMTALASALDTITGLRVYAYQADGIAAPAAVVGFPSIDYDYTHGDGSDRAVFPVTLIVGRVSDRSARTRLGQYLGRGSSSAKAAVESDPTLGGVVQTVRAMGAEVSPLTIEGVEYIAAELSLEVMS